MINPLQTLGKLKAINADYWQTVHSAKKNGKFIAYTNAFSPVELLYSMDFLPVYPENHAVILGAKRQNDKAMKAASEMGYGPNLCSYARTDLGDMHAKTSPVGGMPKPDLLMVSNCQCGTLHKWFEAIARAYGVPMVLLDVPHAGNSADGGDEVAKSYVRAQLEKLVAVMEDISGRSFNMERLGEVLRESQTASRLWEEALGLGARVPAPLTVFDQFIAMAPIVAQRGTRIATDFYRELVAELRERTALGVGSVEPERFRLFWDNLPMWPALRSLSDLLARKGVALVSAFYTHCWTNLAVDPADPFGQWSGDWAGFRYATHINLERRIAAYADLAERFKLDGFLFHSNLSCKMISQFIPDLKQALHEKTGLPGLVIDADHNDPQRYSISSLMLRIEAFVEMLGASKNRASN
jgi:benzoyl-CoA reductase/2-hydroxyglutaryl-CoA dehydratase subunit BcrC/BadD/HgdB